MESGRKTKKNQGKMKCRTVCARRCDLRCCFGKLQTQRVFACMHVNGIHRAFQFDSQHVFYVCRFRSHCCQCAVAVKWVWAYERSKHKCEHFIHDFSFNFHFICYARDRILANAFSRLPRLVLLLGNSFRAPHFATFPPRAIHIFMLSWAKNKQYFTIWWI